MIGMALRAPANGVKIADRKVTRTEVVGMFKKQLKHLKERLNVKFYFSLVFSL